MAVIQFYSHFDLFLPLLSDGLGRLFFDLCLFVYLQSERNRSTQKVMEIF